MIIFYGHSLKVQRKKSLLRNSELATIVESGMQNSTTEQTKFADEPVICSFLMKRAPAEKGIAQVGRKQDTTAAQSVPYEN
jgi:hypothetical protein